MLLCTGLACAQDVTLTARVELLKGDKAAKAPEAENVVVWLVPEGAGIRPAFHRNHVPPAQSPAIGPEQQELRAACAGGAGGLGGGVPQSRSILSQCFFAVRGKRFDLGLYEAGSTRDVHFDKPGISYIFCNIHPEMSAVVIALDTPYYGISDARGQVVIANVPSGKYTLRVWYEATPPETLKAMTREVTVSEASSTLGVLRLTEANLPTAHKNLYGRDYDSPAPDSPAYERH